MNQQLINDIRDRIKKANAERVDELVLSAHLDAIAEVYETDRQTVESIARDVIAENGRKIEGVDFVKLRNTLWVCALILVIVSVLWLLHNNLRSTPATDSQSLTKSKQRTVQYVSEALSSLNILKISIIENHQTTGKLPSSFKEIGFKESEVMSTKYIDRIQLSEQGAITANFSKLVGEQLYLKLIPTIQVGGFHIEWDCRSNLEQVILDEFTGCTLDD